MGKRSTASIYRIERRVYNRGSDLVVDKKYVTVLLLLTCRTILIKKKEEKKTLLSSCGFEPGTYAPNYNSAVERNMAARRRHTKR